MSNIVALIVGALLGFIIATLNGGNCLLFMAIGAVGGLVVYVALIKSN